jgi:hypothetical protein
MMKGVALVVSLASTVAREVSEQDDDYNDVEEEDDDDVRDECCAHIYCNNS